MLAGEHAAEQRAAAFDEHLEHAFAAEQRERLVEIDAGAAGGRRRPTSTFAPAARHASTAPARASSVRDDERRRERRRRTADRPRERDRARRAARAVGGCSGASVDVAHGELRPIGERGARADHDRLRVGAQLVRVGAGAARR